MRMFETAVEWTDTEWAYFSSDERRWINKIRRLKEKHPDEIEILREPETNDGCIYCKIKPNWVKISPPKKCTLTPEQRAKQAQILLQSRGKRT